MKLKFLPVYWLQIYPTYEREYQPEAVLPSEKVNTEISKADS
jgi:hypothetical protein